MEAYKSQDIVLPVGKFQMNLTNPVAGSTNFYNPGSSVTVVQRLHKMLLLN